MESMSNAQYDYSRIIRPCQYARWEHKYCGPYRDHTRAYEYDERGDMPMPDEIAKARLDRYRTEEIFYARELLNTACNGWYLEQARDMAHLLKCLDAYREKRIEEKKKYNELNQELMARIEAHRGQ